MKIPYVQDKRFSAGMPFVCPYSKNHYSFKKYHASKTLLQPSITEMKSLLEINEKGMKHALVVGVTRMFRETARWLEWKGYHVSVPFALQKFPRLYLYLTFVFYTVRSDYLLTM